MTHTKQGPAALALAAVAALALGLAGCSKPAAKTDAASTTTTTTATTTTASTSPVSTATPGLPAECNAYFDKVTTCVNKLDASNPMKAQFKTSMDQARAQWATIADKTTLVNVCKQSSATFSQSSAAMGC